MKLLIIGGTQFVGRALAEAALADGHEVTLFNRGNTNPDLFAEVEKLRGDRDNDLSALEGRKWDAAIDTCGYIPRHVKMTAELLADSVDLYTFISTISVYDGEKITGPGAKEDAALKMLEDESVEEVTGETYGGLKVLCERAADAAMPGRVLHVRPGLIIGPHDPTDRFTFWPVNVARGGRLLAPPPDAPMQVIDTRDLAAWTLAQTAAGTTGAFTATGPAESLTFGAMLATCRAIAGDSAAEVLHADADFLTENGVSYWSDLPLWSPPDNEGMMQLDISKAVNAGLRFRPLADTIADTLAWFDAERGDALKTGISPERHAEVLAAWDARES